MQAQETDPELTCLFLNLLDAAEANKVATCFYKSQRILMRKKLIERFYHISIGLHYKGM